MTILGIETSCDDTGVSIVEVAPTRVGVVFNILSNTISSQIKVHRKYGGVVPNLAAREHLKNIEPCLRQALKQAKIKPEQIDLIAVTIGPGLIPSLLIGVHFAKTLAYKWNKPIIGINHIEAHIVAALISNSIQYSGNIFPAIASVVSGGHTQLVLIKKIGSPPHQNFGSGDDYKIIGETRDDAAGECFDKIAKLLRLGYPGGPAIAACAAESRRPTAIPKPNQNLESRIQLPRPMIGYKNYDFSFSGLKTAVLYLVKKLEVRSSRKEKSQTSNLEPKIVSALCAETQQAIIDVLIEKTIRAAKEYKAKTVILSGGVAANNELRKQLESRIQNLESRIQFLVPPKNLCTDNAAMIAMAGYFNRNRATKNYNRIKANANLRLS